jgi:hypothetical protein
MGRPLNKRFFGNTNPNGVGGEAVESVTVVTGDSADYSAADVVTFTAPQIAGGSTATGTIAVDGAGAVTGITVTNGGSGYTSAPTVTITTSTGSQTTLTLTAVLTSVRLNAIAAYAITTESGTNQLGDIVRQVGSRRYVVKTADGVGICKLVTDGIANEVGEMTITATDSEGNLYFVDKITSRLVRLFRIEDESVTSWLYNNGEMAPWTFAPAAGEVVSVANN